MGRRCPRGGRGIGSYVLVGLLRENGVTPARFAISCSPICQCIASTALQGMAISSATFDHISARNLVMAASVHGLVTFEGDCKTRLQVGFHDLVRRFSTYLSYNLASLFLRSSSHSLLLSR